MHTHKDVHVQTHRLRNSCLIRTIFWLLICNYSELSHQLILTSQRSILALFQGHFLSAPAWLNALTSLICHFKLVVYVGKCKLMLFFLCRKQADTCTQMRLRKLCNLCFQRWDEGRSAEFWLSISGRKSWIREWKNGSTEWKPAAMKKNSNWISLWCLTLLIVFVRRTSAEWWY